MTDIVTKNGKRTISLVSYVSPSGTVPVNMQRMAEGYPSVNDMLGRSWFQLAHRGGSRDYSEHSEQAYTNAYVAGYGAFEVAVATSSDGTLFLMHDATLLRTSNLDQSARATPWATIKDLKIIKPTTAVAGATDRSYLTLDKYFDLFGNHGVHFIDTKYLYPADRVTLRNMIVAKGLTSRVLGKVVLGDSSTYAIAATLAKEWQDAGIKVAGLMYAINKDDFPSLVGTYDVLGMEYTADQTVWDALKNAGGSKKIIGHIAPNTSSVTTAKTKGASGCICSSPMTTPVLTGG